MPQLPLVEQICPADPEAMALMARLDHFQGSLYPPASNHLDSAATLSRSNVMMAGLKIDGHLAGIGAVKFLESHAEIKRMFVAEPLRGKGLASRILNFLLAQAALRKTPLVCLETGIFQPEAVGLYEKAGFKKRGPFGSYVEDPLSVFMEKEITADQSGLSILPFDHKTPENETLEVIGLWEAAGLTRPWNDPRKDILRKLAHSPSLFFLARVCQTLVGTCMAGYDGHRGWIYYLGVHPAFQRLGIAGKMVAHAESTLAGLGCPKIDLMVRDGNDRAQRFYRAQGFEDDPVRVMGKRLKSDL